MSPIAMRRAALAVMAFAICSASVECILLPDCRVESQTREISLQPVDCPPPSAELHTYLMEGSICKADFVPNPLQVHISGWSITGMKTSYYCNGFTGWVTNAYKVPSWDISKAIEIAKVSPLGVAETPPSPWDAFDQRYAFKVGYEAARYTYTITPISTIMTSGTMGVWESDVDSDMLRRWKSVELSGVKYLYKDFTDHTLAFEVPRELEVTCDPCMNRKYCRSDKILGCKTIGTLDFTPRDVKTGELVRAMAPMNDYRLFSRSTTDFLFSYGTVYRYNRVIDCSGVLVHILSTSGAYWYLRDVKDKTVRRTKRGIDTVFSSLGGMQATTNTIIQSLIDKENADIAKVSGALVNLAAAMDDVSTTTIDTINYLACSVRKLRVESAMSLLASSPVGAVAAALGRTTRGIKYLGSDQATKVLRYSVCPDVSLNCPWRGYEELTSEGTCYSTVCLDLKGATVYNMNGVIHTGSRYTKHCESDDFWEFNSGGVAHLSSSGRLSYTSGDVVVKGVNFNQSRLVTTAEIPVLLRSQAYSGLEADFLVSHEALVGALGQTGTDVVTALYDAMTSGWMSLLQRVSTLFMWVFIFVQIAINCVVLKKKNG